MQIHVILQEGELTDVVGAYDSAALAIASVTKRQKEVHRLDLNTMFSIIELKVQTLPLEVQMLDLLRKLRDDSPATWSAIMNSNLGPEVASIWDQLKEDGGHYDGQA